MTKPYMQFYFRDHLSDLGLRQCHPISRGIWIDLLCWMGQGEPYGHLRTDARPVAAPPTSRTGRTASPAALPPATPTTPPPAGPAAPPHAGPSAPPHGTPDAPPDGIPDGLLQTMYKAGKDGSLEPCLPSLLGMEKHIVEWAIADLEQHHVFSRTPSGVIYCRRMVRDQQKHDERVRKALEAYNKRHRGQGNGTQNPPNNRPSPPPTRPPATPSALPDAPPHGVPSGPAYGGASGGPQTPPAAPPRGGPYNHNQSIKDSSPLPPPLKGGGHPTVFPERLTRAQRQELERQQAIANLRKHQQGEH